MIALVHHTATIQRPCSRPGFCSINEDIKTSFLCEHGIIPIPLPYYLQNFCLMIETESELSFPCHARTRNMDIFTFDKELELSIKTIKMHSLIVLYQFIKLILFSSYLSAKLWLIIYLTDHLQHAHRIYLKLKLLSPFIVWFGYHQLAEPVIKSVDRPTWTKQR